MITPGERNLTWLFNRLLAMSIREIFFRLKFAVLKKIWRAKIPTYEAISYDLQKITSVNEIPDFLTEDAKLLLLKEADGYLAGKWYYFGQEITEGKVSWHKDPISGIIAPKSFGLDINHRDEEVVGNIKYIWEKNRHHHLTVVAHAYFLTKDEKYAEFVCKNIEDWILENPYLMGVNWTHPLEQGIRLISWVHIDKLLKGSKFYNTIFGSEGFIWPSIFQHQKFIYESYSRGSSANNHLIGEMAGLYISCVRWPIFDPSPKWQRKSQEILEKEMQKQNYSDGVNREMGFSYQLFVIEFALLCVIEKNQFTDSFQEMLKKMIKYVVDVKSILGVLPNYGDGDEGMALQLSPLESGQLNWIFSFSEKIKMGEFNQFTRQSGNNFYSKEAGLLAAAKMIKKNRWSYLFDFGPLGMGTMAAHGHADALSVTLNIDGKEIFVDTGTYCYHDNLKWRKYFRGTKAHNTLIVNDVEQSEQLGPFLWGKRANSMLCELDLDRSICVAKHDGYKSQNIEHTRKLIYDEVGLKIIDNVIGTNESQLELRFHLHPDVKVSLANQEILLVRDDLILKMSIDERFEMDVLYGEENGGWYSPVFGIKVPTNTIIMRQVLPLPVEIETKLEIVQ